MKKILLLMAFFACFHGIKAQSVTITPSGITPSLSSNFEKLTFEQIQAKTGMENGDAVLE